MNPEEPLFDPLADLSPHRRRRLWPWLIGFTILAIIAVCVVASIQISNAVQLRLDQAIAEASVDDPNWQIDDLLAHREFVPESENSALLISKALGFVPDVWPAAPKGRSGQPINGRSVVEEAFEHLNSNAINAPIDPLSIKTLQVDLARFPETIRLLRKVADYRRGRNEVKLGPTLIDTSFVQTTRLRNAARLLQADAAIRALDGDFDGALESCRAILGVGRSIGDEPFSLCQLVRIAIGRAAMRSAQQVLAQGEPSDEALARFQADLELEKKEPILLRTIRGERAVSSELIRRIGEGELPLEAIGGLDPRKAHPKSWVAPWGQVSYRYQRAVMIEWQNKMIALAKRPTHERAKLFAEIEAEVEHEKTSGSGPSTPTLAILLMPAYSSVLVANSRYEAELGAMILLVAAERSRKKTGHWPSSFDSFDRTILPEVPLDPMSGKPYLSFQKDGRIVIYSVGLNLQDEKGANDPKNPTGTPDDIAATAWDAEHRKPSAR